MDKLVEDCPREIVVTQRLCYSILALALASLSVSILIQVPAAQRRARKEWEDFKQKYFGNFLSKAPEPREKFVTSGRFTEESDEALLRSKGGRKPRDGGVVAEGSDEAHVRSKGGRKSRSGGGRSSKSRILPLSESRNEDESFQHADEIQEELYGHEDTLSTSETYINPDETPQPEEPEPARESKHERAPSAFETGIRNFNLKKAEGSGGRPFGLTVEREGDGEEREDAGEGSSEGSKEGTKERTKKDERKPVAIRLDLNLEIEIFLKAKIKGDVTITFLE